jgi:hypothetical protein
LVRSSPSSKTLDGSLLLLNKIAKLVCQTLHDLVTADLPSLILTTVPFPFFLTDTSESLLLLEHPKLFPAPGPLLCYLLGLEDFSSALYPAWLFSLFLRF